MNKGQRLLDWNESCATYDLLSFRGECEIKEFFCSTSRFSVGEAVKASSQFVCAVVSGGGRRKHPAQSNNFDSLCSNLGQTDVS